MKKFLAAILGVMTALLVGCGQTDEVVPGVTIRTKLAQMTEPAVHGVIADSSGKPTFNSGDGNIVIFGVENDQWETLNMNRAYFDKYIEASLNINANAIAIHMPWAVLEPQEGFFATGESSYLQYCVDAARKAGLKICVYFTSTNYASGDGSFVPSYIREDKETYTRIVIPGEYDGNDETVASQISYCVNNPALKEKEKLATQKLMEFIKKNNEDGIFTAVNIGSEIDYSRNWDSGSAIRQDLRCTCEHCNALFQVGQGHEGETPYEFMLRSFNGYLKEMVDAAAETYNEVAFYTPVAALTWFAGGRYVEQPDKIKATVGRDNFFVCPSIAPTPNYALYDMEMDYFVAIPGNAAFASGIDTGHDGIPHNNQTHLEVAPWRSVLKYGGLGAIYWDYPQASNPNNSVLTQDAAITRRLRLGWAPLKATQYYISRFKGDGEVLGWWSYEEVAKTLTLGAFTVSVNRAEESTEEHENYGIALLMDDRELVIASTAFTPRYGENNDIRVTVPGSGKDYTVEIGYFDVQGVWVKTGTYTPLVEQNQLVLTPENENGNYTKNCFRIYK